MIGRRRAVQQSKGGNSRGGARYATAVKMEINNLPKYEIHVKHMKAARNVSVISEYIPRQYNRRLDRYAIIYFYFNYRTIETTGTGTLYYI